MEFFQRARRRYKSRRFCIRSSGSLSSRRRDCSIECQNKAIAHIVRQFINLTRRQTPSYAPCRALIILHWCKAAIHLLRALRHAARRTYTRPRSKTDGIRTEAALPNRHKSAGALSKRLLWIRWVRLPVLRRTKRPLKVRQRPF